LGKKKAAGCCPATFFKSWLPSVDNLRNFLLTPPTEMLSFFQNLRVWSLTHAMTRSVPCILKVNQALRFGRSIDQFVEVAPRTRGAQFRYPLTPNEKQERFSQFRKTIDEVEEIIASQDSALKAPFNGYKQRWEKQGRLALRLSQFLMPPTLRLAEFTLRIEQSTAKRGQYLYVQ
jgi:hypothetical protein